MNLFYHDVNLDVEKLKPSAVEEGQVCVVYWSALKSWCRALVEFVVLHDASPGLVASQAYCLLVDHGECIAVNLDQIRAAVKCFLQLPFWARRFRLAGINPTTLRVSICEEKAELVPSSQWDSSATRYLHNLLQACTQMEAILQENLEDRDGSTSIQLYLTINNVKICANDDLVAKRFAYYSKDTTRIESQESVLDRSPALLACDIFTDTKMFLASNGCRVQTLSPVTSSKYKTANTPGTTATKPPRTRTTNTPGTMTANLPGTMTTNIPGTMTTQSPGTMATNTPRIKTTNSPRTTTTNPSGTTTTNPPGTMATNTPTTMTTNNPGTTTTNPSRTTTTNPPGTMAANTTRTVPTNNPGTMITNPPGTMATNTPTTMTTNNPGTTTTNPSRTTTTNPPRTMATNTTRTMPTNNPGTMITNPPGTMATNTPTIMTTNNPGTTTTNPSRTTTTNPPGTMATNTPRTVPTNNPGTMITNPPGTMATNTPRTMTTNNPGTTTTNTPRTRAHAVPLVTEKTRLTDPGPVDVIYSTSEPEPEKSPENNQGSSEGHMSKVKEIPGDHRVNCLVSASSSESITSEPGGFPGGLPDQAETPGRPSSKDEQACARLLEWLNPDTTDHTVSPSQPSRDGLLLHSALPVEPCTCLANAPITDTLRKTLRMQQHSDLSLAESYCWPAVARGVDTLLISPSADQPLSYLPSLLTLLQLCSLPGSITSRSGPLAVVLCPGWEKAQTVSDLLYESQTTQTLHPMTVLLGVARDEAKTVKIPKNCLLLVTTPCSLVRLLACHCFLFLHLCHLVLDDVDQLFSLFSDQMVTILQHFQKVTSAEERTSCPRQLLAVGKCWSSHMEGLLTNHMSSPCIIITLPEEAALYAGVHQMILLALESTKISVLLGVLDFNPDVGQKTLIITSSAEEVEQVFKAVSNTSALCLKSHEGLTHQFDLVMQQWRKDIGPGTQVIMVTTDDCLKALGIRDAMCVVHYSFPSSPRLFGRRLFCMVHNFRNLTHKQPVDSPCSQPCQSVLLISERNVSHVVGLLRYLKRTDALVPPELLSFSQGVLLAREKTRSSRPLCQYLKSFGVCRDRSACPDRHRFNSQLDQSLLPASGVITVLPLYIKSASVYYGRIVRKPDDCYESMASEMVSYYAQERLAAIEVEEGGLYGVQEEEIFHRVKVTLVPDRGERLFFSVLVLFVDEGREQEIKAHQLLQLPAQFHSLPPQAVELVVCRVKPVDSEPDWNPKITRTISQMIRGLQHQARVMLSLGNTVFIDPMVKVTRVPGVRTVINDHDVRSEILDSGMGTSNPQHLDLLRALCQGGVATDSQAANEIYGLESLEGGLVSLEDRMQAAEEALANAFRTAELRNLCGPEVSVDPAQPQTCTEAAGPGPSQTPDPGPLALKPTVPETPALEPRGPDQTTQSDNQARTGEFDDSHRSSQQTISIDSPASFHPRVLWYQKTDSLTVTVKLTNPESQSCEFYPSRVVYSCRVGSRAYRADLELHGTIAAERCSWEMSCNEPVLTLVKQPQGDWTRLLKHKNNLISYDLDHYEEEEDYEEDSTSNGVQFVEDNGEDCIYVDSKSGSESD
ncbi:putative ATP-dependent RNA helicase TDRD12 [Polymixia lowei]